MIRSFSIEQFPLQSGPINIIISNIHTIFHTILLTKMPCHQQYNLRFLIHIYPREDIINAIRKTILMK